MRTKITIGVIVVFIIAVIIVVISSSNSSQTMPPVGQPGATTSAGSESTNPNGGSIATTSTTGTTGKTYTLAQISTHRDASSCWTTINGGVYDVTTWINQHPGGPEAILSLCGKDGSDAFNGQHGGQARPASELATFKIGILAK